MRSATLGLFAVLLIGFAALLLVGLSKGSALVYTLGVAPQGPVAQLKPGSRACQGPVRLPDGSRFERIGFYPRAAGGPGSPVGVTVRAAAGGPTLARGVLAGGYRSGSPPPLRQVTVGRQRQGPPLTVCFRNAGSRPLELWGTAAIASPSTLAIVDGKPADFDLGVTFERSGQRSLIALAPTIAERASVFHPQWVSPVAYALIAALVLIGAPALLLLAVRRAAASD
jgi:hypothetical protein